MELRWHVNQNKMAVGFIKTTCYSIGKVTSLLGEKVCFFSVIPLKSLKSSLFDIIRKDWNLTPGLHISRKDRKHMFTNRSFSFQHMPWSSHSCNDRRYSYFTRNICNRYVDSFKTLFRTRSQACCAIVTTIWRSGLTEIKLRIK